MQVVVTSRGFRRSEALVEHAHTRVGNALARYRENVRRVEVQLSDENGPRGGLDKRCRLQVALRGHPPLRVQQAASDLYAAVALAVGRIDHAVARALARRRSGRHANTGVPA